MIRESGFTALTGGLASTLPLPHICSFYIATDENSAYAVDLIHRHGGILINDLLTPDDRTVCGWEMLYSDLVALVEQIVMSRASYWNAHAMSSLAGGVVNLRAARGADPRTALLD
jgi:hypothetical protein